MQMFCSPTLSSRVRDRQSERALDHHEAHESRAERSKGEGIALFIIIIVTSEREQQQERQPRNTSSKAARKVQSALALALEPKLGAAGRPNVICMCAAVLSSAILKTRSARAWNWSRKAKAKLCVRCVCACVRAPAG